MNTAWQVKGSGRVGDMTKLVHQWLPACGQERDDAGDWRLLFLDSFRARFDIRIKDLCMEWGYVVLFHYGHTTGTFQVNDVGPPRAVQGDVPRHRVEAAP